MYGEPSTRNTWPPLPNGLRPIGAGDEAEKLPVSQPRTLSFSAWPQLKASGGFGTPSELARRNFMTKSWMKSRFG